MSPTPLTIILDLDHTVLNTHKLKKMLAQCGVAYGVTPRMFWHAYRTVRQHCLVSPRALIDALPATTFGGLTSKSIESKLYKAFVNAIKDVGAYTYHDAQVFLRWATQKRCHVVFYTYGDPFQQRLKITGLKKQFRITKAVVTTKEAKHHDILTCLPKKGPWIWLDDVPHFPEKSLHIDFRRGHYIQVRRKQHMPVVLRGDVHVVKNLSQARKYIQHLLA